VEHDHEMTQSQDGPAFFCCNFTFQLFSEPGNLNLSVMTEGLYTPLSVFFMFTIGELQSTKLKPVLFQLSTSLSSAVDIQYYPNSEQQTTFF